jgi:hypothetical protein
LDGISQIPGEQLFNAFDGMFGDPDQHQAKIGIRLSNAPCSCFAFSVALEQ